MTNREKFITRVLEMVNKKHKTNFKMSERELPENTFVIVGCVNGRHYAHCFEAETAALNYKTIKKYAKALIEVIKNNLINAKKK